jgi:hypothetical protein
MKVATLLLTYISSVISSPSASPLRTWQDDPQQAPKQCLSDADAVQLVDIMVSLSVAFTPAHVRGFLTDDFILQSDSINWFLDLPSGASTFDDPDALIEAAYSLTQSAPQPPIAVSFVCFVLFCPSSAHPLHTQRPKRWRWGLRIEVEPGS